MRTTPEWIVGIKRRIRPVTLDSAKPVLVGHVLGRLIRHGGPYPAHLDLSAASHGRDPTRLELALEFLEATTGCIRESVPSHGAEEAVLRSPRLAGCWVLAFEIALEAEDHRLQLPKRFVRARWTGCLD